MVWLSGKEGSEMNVVQKQELRMKVTEKRLDTSGHIMTTEEERLVRLHKNWFIRNFTAEFNINSYKTSQSVSSIKIIK